MRGGAGDGPSTVTVPASASLNVSTVLPERADPDNLTFERMRDNYSDLKQGWGLEYVNLFSFYLQIR